VYARCVCYPRDMAKSKLTLPRGVPTVSTGLRLPADMANRLDDISSRLGVSRAYLMFVVLQREFPTDDLPTWWDDWIRRPLQPDLMT
jgi:hypothetical protein